MGGARGATARSTRLLQPTDVILEKLIRASQQAGVVGVLFDHVTEITEIVDQQLNGSLPFPYSLQSLEQVENDVLDLGSLDLDRDLESALQIDAAIHLAVQALKQGTQMLDPIRCHGHRQGAAGRPLHQPCHQCQGPEVTGLVLGHVEPERAQAGILAKEMLELAVQMHALAL